MYFKPRIFISSTFDLIPIRKKIDDIFVKSGAELMLYEKNLTPSTTSATYRKDIQEADFVIFIFDTRYGSKTSDTGMSGTHEEWRIANSYNIPCHVYIKHKGEKESELSDLIDELQKNSVSFYYYKDAKDLVKRMKETIFTIASEIAYKRIEDINLTETDIKKLAMKHDYTLALQIIKLVEDIRRLSIDFDLFDTNVFVNILEYVELSYNYNKEPFVNPKLNDRFAAIVNAYNVFSNLHVNIYSSTSNRRKANLKTSGGYTTITYMTYHGQPGDRDKLKELMDNFIKEYDQFRSYVMNQKMLIDSL